MLIDVNPMARGRKASIRTIEIRASLQALVDGEVHHLAHWIRQTAEGIPLVDGEGKVVTSLDGTPLWLNKPDPATAVKLVNDLAEYVMPKLSRADVEVVATVEAKTTTVASLEQMPTADLRRLIQEKLAAIRVKPEAENEVIDAEVVETPPLPSWITG